jgi:hypothetical protein
MPDKSSGFLEPVCSLQANLQEPKEPFGKLGGGHVSSHS